MYNVTQEDIDLLCQRDNNYQCKIQLLNMDMQLTDEIEGIFIDADFKCSASSDVRRTLDLTSVVNELSSMVAERSNVWLDKRIRVLLGCTVIRTGEVKWYSLGLYNFVTNSYAYDAATRTLSISCEDLMSELNGELNGVLSGIATKIAEGHSIRAAIIQTVTQLGGIRKYRVEYQDDTVPYDLEYGPGVTVWEILQELRDLYYSYEMFLDEDTFVCQRVPMNNEYPIVLSDDVFGKCVISEHLNNDFSEVKNVVEVFGESTRYDYYSDAVTYASNTYTAVTTGADIKKNKKISFVAPQANAVGDKLIIRNTVDGSTTNYTYTLYQYGLGVDAEDVLLPAGTLQENKYYVFKLGDNNRAYLLGQTQVHAIVKFVSDEPNAEAIAKDKEYYACDNIGYIINPESPFTVEKIGERLFVCDGGDYSKIANDTLAIQRAEYEVYVHARLTDSISVDALLIPWLDVNNKITYKAYMKPEDEPVQYIVNDISFRIGEGTMSISMARFYPFYPNTVKLANTILEEG